MPIPVYFFNIFIVIIGIFLAFDIFKSLKNAKRNKKDIFINFMEVVIIIFLLFLSVHSCQQEDKYLEYLNNLSYLNIERISFYEYLNKNDSDDDVLKGTLILEIKVKKNLKKFIYNSWEDIEKCFERAFGKTFVLEIKMNNNNIFFKAEKSHNNNYIKLTPLTKNAQMIVPSVTEYKSYKLYKYFDILEKKEKELNKNRDK